MPSPHSQEEIDPEFTAVILAAAQLIGRSLEPAVTIGGILRLLSSRLKLERGRVILPDPETGILHIVYAHGLSAEDIRKGVYARGEGITGRVLLTGEVAVVPDVAREPRFLALITADRDRLPHPLAYIAVPIVQKDNPIGVLAVERHAPDRSHFVHDLNLLQIVAAMIGQILQINALVQEQTTELRQEYERLKQLDSMEGEAVYGIVGRSPALRRAVEEARKAAASSQATVMLIGESGTGKERFARMIHLASERRDQPFVCINCAAIPPNLLEAELFGHEKGSFTGAVGARPGKFEIAAGGTLFLDEIGDMAVDLQAKLLRVLQERTVQRLGGDRDIAVDVRIVSATNKQLEEAVKANAFRLDLYYRLMVIPITLPPLRERNGDIQLMALYFLARYNQQQQRDLVFTPEALERLAAYDWPGNVRQLENIIERLVIMSDSDRIGAAEIARMLETESPLRADPAPDDGVADSTPRPYRKVQSNERERIIAALRRAGGNKTHAARQLGMSPRQLHYRLMKLKIREEGTGR
jgi:Nif-specific regulatory protein